MLKQRRQAAETVAEKLYVTEDAIDEAITHASDLAGCMPRVRRESGLSALFGQDALEEAIAAVGCLGEARRRLVEAHRRLSETQRQMGLGAVAFGGSGPKPEEPAVVGPSLRTISTAA